MVKFIFSIFIVKLLFLDFLTKLVWILSQIISAASLKNRNTYLLIGLI